MEQEMWLARDKSNELFLYIGINKPVKEEEQWIDFDGDWIELDSILFPDVKWSDEEPTKVKLILEN